MGGGEGIRVAFSEVKGIERYRQRFKLESEHARESKPERNEKLML